MNLFKSDKAKFDETAKAETVKHAKWYLCIKI